VSRLNKPRGVPILCYVTDRHLLPTEQAAELQETLLRKIEAAAAAGVDWIQIREKDLSGKDSGSLTREALQCVASYGVRGANSTRILVNDRLDVALSGRAGGVHLGENSLPIGEARRFANARAARKDFLMGVSCHSLETARSAERGGADYIFFGPVYATPSKAGYGAPQRLERLAEVCRAVAVPVLAIGGVTVENAASCLAAGAVGIAAIRLFQEAQEVASVVKALRTQKD
jgi:thiamine-phosphate pyrophosphorylase